MGFECRRKQPSPTELGDAVAPCMQLLYRQVACGQSWPGAMQPPQRFPAKLPSHIDPDDAIRLTDDDAASSRLSVSPPGPDDRLGEIERRLPHRRLHVHRAKYVQASS